MKRENLLMFPIGALGYGLIEILWRGHTHPSMLTAGGICFVFFGKIGEKYKNQSLVKKAVIGSIFITFIELVFGIIFNLLLKKKVWDYSKMPFNFLGQICLLYSVFWGILSLIFIPLATSLKVRLQKK
ncbi:MAG: putative ABC transporter permease [Clostridia bacterium]|nr:putative ABC transporter permease [Clostridia bacterium]